MKALDLHGQRFGRLVAKRRGPANKFKHSTWECVCDCGNTTFPETQRLRDGRTTSCGCKVVEARGLAQLRHGGCVKGISREYSAWRGAVARCLNPANKSYARYGGRGINICERWLDFANFIEDMGKRPENTSLDRINNDGNYEPGNCRWATPREQTRNKRSNIWITLADGSKVILKDFAAMHGIDYHCIYARHVRGQPLLVASR